LKNGQPERAASFLRQAYGRAPSNPVVVLNLAVLADEHLLNRELALELYKKYLSLTSRNPELDSTRLKVEARIEKLNEKRN